MAFLGRYGSVSPEQYDRMDADRTMAYAHQVGRLRKQEVDLMINLAKFVAGARIQSEAAEVRG